MLFVKPPMKMRRGITIVFLHKVLGGDGMMSTKI